MSSFTCFSVPHRSGTIVQAPKPPPSSKYPLKTKKYEKLTHLLSGVQEPCSSVSFCNGYFLSSPQRPLKVSKAFVEELLSELKQGVNSKLCLQLLVQVIAQKCFLDIQKGISLLQLVLERNVFTEYIQLVEFFYNVNIYCHFLWFVASFGTENDYSDEKFSLPWSNLFQWLKESVLLTKVDENVEISANHFRLVLEQIFGVFCTFSVEKLEHSEIIIEKEAALRCILSFIIDPHGNVRHELVKKMPAAVWLECVKVSTYLSTELEALTCFVLCIYLSEEMEPEFIGDYLSMNVKMDENRLDLIGGERSIVELFTLVHSFKARRILFSIILHILSNRLNLSATGSSSLYEIRMTNITQSVQEFIVVLQNRLAAEAFPYVFRRCPRNFAFDVLRRVFIDSILFNDEFPHSIEKVDKPFVVGFFSELERTAIEYQGVHVTPEDESIEEVENEFWVTNPVSSVVAMPFEMPHEIIQRLLLSSSPWDARFGERHIADVIAYSLNAGSEPTTLLNLYKSWVSGANSWEVHRLLESLAHIFQHIFILFRELGKESKLSRCMNLSLDWYVAVSSCCHPTSALVSSIIHFFDSFLDFLVDWRELSDISIFKQCDCVAELVCLGNVNLRADCISSLALKSLSPFAQLLRSISENTQNERNLQFANRHVEWKMWKHVRLSLLFLLHLRGMPIESYLQDVDPAIRKMSSFILTEFPNSVLVDRSPSQLMELISHSVES